MKIAYTMSRGRGDTDLLLARLAERLLARGCRVSGTVQINTECDADGPCDMDVRVLPDGPVIRISQSLGKRKPELVIKRSLAPRRCILPTGE